MTSHDDPAYGLSVSLPIRVGGGIALGAKNERRYLDHLEGPAGEKVFYTRLGSRPPSEAGHPGAIDIYEVAHDGIQKPIVLYLDMYLRSEFESPAGFVYTGPPVYQPPEPPPRKPADDTGATSPDRSWRLLDQSSTVIGYVDWSSEGQPELRNARQHQHKSAVLQTYFASLLSRAPREEWGAVLAEFLEVHLVEESRGLIRAERLPEQQLKQWTGAVWTSPGWISGPVLTRLLWMSLALVILLVPLFLLVF